MSLTPAPGRIPLSQHSVLFSLRAQEGEAVPNEVVRVPDNVAPERRRAYECLVHGGEGFHREYACVVDVFQAAEDLVPVDVRRPRRAAVGLGEVHVAQARAEACNRPVETLLLDVHVVRVEVDENVRLAYPIQQFRRLRSDVDEICLVAVDGLDPELDAVLRGASGRPFEDAGDDLQFLWLRWLAGERTHVRVERTGKHGRSQGCRRLYSLVEEASRSFGVGG